MRVPIDDSFEQVAGAPAVCSDAGGRGKLRVTGSDRVRFLDGMLTQALGDAAPGDRRPAAQLDRKGRLVADLFVLVDSEAVLLDTAEGRAGAVLEILEKHVIADDVRIEDLSADRGHLVVEGPGARAAAARVAPVPPEGRFEAVARAAGAILWVGGGILTETGVQAIGPREVIEALASELALPSLAPEDAETLRVMAFVPRFGVDMTERSFPAEARLEDAISWEKGCYIGQEIVARIHSRGQVNRLLVQLQAEALPAAGAAITAGDGEEREVGVVTSAAVGPRGAVALGYVRREHAAPGARLSISGAPAVVLGPRLAG
jgi:folate-binding protein YgfZ